MRAYTFFGIAVVAGSLIAGTITSVQAVEEGQLVKKDGKWKYYSGEMCIRDRCSESQTSHGS